MVADSLDQIARLGQNISIKHVLWVGSKSRPYTVDVCIERKEAIGVPNPQNDLAHRFSDIATVLGHGKIATAHERRRHQVPAQGVGAIGVERERWVGRILEPLGKFPFVLVQYYTVADAIAERGAIEERCRQDHECIEPAPRLRDIFNDEVAREIRLEAIFVFEWVMKLRERHRS